MKPVDKGQSLGTLARYPDAKPELLLRLGLQCSYCEEPGSPQSLHIEHIYPKDPHPEFEREWDNFLVACSTCNTYKHHHLGSARQTDLEGRYVWPHRENTMCAFHYFDDGRVEVVPGLSADLSQAAGDTLNMIGAMKSPAAAANYGEDIAYDGMEKRKEMWEIASENRRDYLASDGAFSPGSIARNASKMGHFSIWMAVFHDRPEVRSELIRQFKAASNCFDQGTQPISRGRL
ncbi:HNH endonuclease [Haloferula chungangensis]|uniref:HNH endonuclease n=1 Tax=Haloferula chungangensis TaxID=1048331 RepID=A0ABW2L495_9BACT